MQGKKLRTDIYMELGINKSEAIFLQWAIAEFAQHLNSINPDAMQKLFSDVDIDCLNQQLDIIIMCESEE